MGEARGLGVNAGNSTAFTGGRGRAAVEAVAARVAGHTGCRPSDVFVASTGVIGVPLPIDKAEAGLDAAVDPPGAEEPRVVAAARERPERRVAAADAADHPVEQDPDAARVPPVADTARIARAPHDAGEREVGASALTALYGAQTGAAR